MGAGGAMGPGGTMGPGGAMPPGESPIVDPACVDGQWEEALPAADVDISQTVNAYNRAEVNAFVQDVLQQRYPVGHHIVDLALREGVFGDCIGLFLRDTGSGAAVIGQLSTVVHECGHSADLGAGDFSSSAYILTDEYTITCRQGDTTSRGGQTFARSRLLDDAYTAFRAPCDGNFGQDCDHYADIYLDGDPDDGNFDGGDQGFNSVLEETAQYVNSLATGHTFVDYYSGSRSERDGILTFLWYVTRYLRMARLDYPQAYAHISGDACWREAVLSVWGRAWLYLDLTEGNGALGISDDAIYALATAPELLDEIQRLRVAHGCR